MKQSSTTSTRGKKKSSGNKSASARGGASQHRTGGKNSGSSRSTGSGSRSSSASNRGSSSSQNRSSGARNGGGSATRSSMRGNQPSSRSSNRSWKANETAAGSHDGYGQFQGQNHLEKFFLDQLQDIYYAEQKITQALPRMIEAATTEELSEAFDDHLHQTHRHIKRLERVFESLGKEAQGKKCEAIEGIAREVDNIIGETEEGTLTRDAALVIAAQKVEHYEIATYGGLVQLAITMQLHEAADLLDRTLVEEEDTDALLTDIAENDINLRAEHEGNEYSWSAVAIYETEEGEEEGEEEEESEEGEEEENEAAENPSV